jgi:hypothetical protein
MKPETFMRRHFARQRAIDREAQNAVADLASKNSELVHRLANIAMPFSVFDEEDESGGENQKPNHEGTA